MAEQNTPPAGEQTQQQIQIKITDEILKGVYANMAIISHSQEEFVLDFMNVYPAQAQGIVNARVVLSPQHVKRIVEAMKENIKKYEDQFGNIKSSDLPAQNFGFRTE